MFGKAAWVLLLSSIAGAAWAGPKYHFHVLEVETRGNVDADSKALARTLLQAELGGRPEFTAELGAAGPGREQELKRRGLKGFDVSMRIEELTREKLPARPGGRLPQMAVGTKVSVFGATIPDEKLAFSGDGEATVQAEVVERRLDAETNDLVKDALAQAIRQAVDQAVVKLDARPGAAKNRRKSKGTAKR